MTLNRYIIGMAYINLKWVPNTPESWSKTKKEEVYFAVDLWNILLTLNSIVFLASQVIWYLNQELFSLWRKAVLSWNDNFSLFKEKSWYWIICYHLNFASRNGITGTGCIKMVYTGNALWRGEWELESEPPAIIHSILAPCPFIVSLTNKAQQIQMPLADRIMDSSKC